MILIMMPLIMILIMMTPNPPTAAAPLASAHFMPPRAALIGRQNFHCELGRRNSERDRNRRAWCVVCRLKRSNTRLDQPATRTPSASCRCSCLAEHLQHALHDGVRRRGGCRVAPGDLDDHRDDRLVRHNHRPDALSDRLVDQHQADVLPGDKRVESLLDRLAGRLCSGGRRATATARVSVTLCR